MVGLMATSSKTTLHCPPCLPGLLQWEAPSPRQATADLWLHRRHSDTQRQGWLGLCGVSGSRCTQGFIWALQESLVAVGFDSKCDFTPPIILSGLLLCPWILGIFLVGSTILLSVVVQQWVEILEFSQEKMRAHPSTPLSLCYVDMSTRGFLFTCLFFLFRMHWVSWTWGFKSFINSQSLFLQLLSLSNSPSSIFLKLF